MMPKYNFLVINGPNLNLLGTREPAIYGAQTYQALCDRITRHAETSHVLVEIYQSNHEGDLVDKIQEAYGSFDGIIINPAAYTHTSIALLDALKSVGIPSVEVHISDVSKREAYRQISYVREHCIKTIIGHGFDGYLEAMDHLIQWLEAQQ